ncbi:MAG: type II toxin-antitoxin system Phd/YefM family antitoxin [Chloroflexi bacterium]|nr:type II toxin-antitoxin system Phd/YefM family antitoxin [Chloroflexota bacterium]
MSTVDMHEARNSLSRLLAQVEAGEDIVITRDGQPVARLVAIEPPSQREFGSLRGQIRLGAAFFDPLPDDELDAWEGA